MEYMIIFLIVVFVVVLTLFIRGKNKLKKSLGGKSFHQVVRENKRKYAR